MASYSSLVALTILGCFIISDVAEAKDYKISKDKVNWFKAFELCAKQGDRLASFVSDTEQKFLISEVVEKKGYGDVDEMWIGLTDLAKDGHHYLASGEAMSWSNWATGQPNSNNNQDCVAMSKAANYKWSYANCYELKPFVCDTATKN